MTFFGFFDILFLIRMIKKPSQKELIGIARNIKLLILDVDGVLTDGGIILDNKGNELKSFHVRDGHGIRMLIRKGIPVALITGRYSRVVERRAKELGIGDVFQKCYDKKKAYRQVAERYALNNSEIAYVGDDIVDLALLNICGLPVTVADAHEAVQRRVKMITKKEGGKGAVREVCDFILMAKGLLKELIDEYS